MNNKSTAAVTWLTLSDAAEHIRASKDTIRAAVSAGDLPAYPIGKGREYRLKANEVDAWLESRAFEPRTT
jgi:excisionase family DNA binding protein